MASRWWRCIAPAVVLVTGCSPGGTSTAPTTSIPPREGIGASSVATTLVIGPEPKGVPGLDAPDVFCATWASYAGTLQALGTAAGFGGIPHEAFLAIEMAAAPRLVEAAAAIDAAWPVELAAEHSVVVDQRVGPYARRAQRAVDAMRGVGVTADELAELSSAWQSALRQRDPGNPVIALVDVDAALQAKVDAAALAFDASVTPFAQDPSLVVDTVAAPATDAYLAAHCPDLAASGVGDAL